MCARVIQWWFFHVYACEMIGRSCGSTMAPWYLVAYLFPATVERTSNPMWRQPMCWRRSTSKKIAGTTLGLIFSSSKHRWHVACGPPLRDFHRKNFWRIRPQDSSPGGSGRSSNACQLMQRHVKTKYDRIWSNNQNWGLLRFVPVYFECCFVPRGCPP